jgi:surface repeat SSSPR-51 protein
MSSKLFKSRKMNRAALAFASFGAVGSVSLMSVVSADTVQDTGERMTLQPNLTADSFDLTKQATGELTFPVQFDRPSGINAAAIAGTVTQLGASSTLYKSCLAAVPDLSNTIKMNSLLSDALNKNSENYNSAREDIVKLINWYNSLGGQQIKTQSGDPYTVDNLNQPINVLAVAFSDANNINSKATETLTTINNAKTVGDVEKALESYKSGVSSGYNDAFNTYAKKVYAEGADLNALSQYSALKPVLDSYQNMYAQGAAAIRTSLLDGASNSTEAGVTFFASAVIAGSNSNNGGDDSNTNVPNDKGIYTTKWVDVTGKTLSAPTTSETGYGDQKAFDGYTYKSGSTDDSTHTKTYVYSKNVTIKETTDWVDEAGKTLKATENGTKPDSDGKSDIDGYVAISTDTTTDADGNKHTINVYHKVVSDTVWVDEAGKVLKEKVIGELPDKDGNSDIDGYELVDVKASTDKNGDRHITNIYKPKTPSKDLPDTYWFDTDGNTLKEKAVGQSLPDNDGKSDIEGYTLESAYVVSEADTAKGGLFAGSTFKVGDVINIYTKNSEVKVHTDWLEQGTNKSLKERADGAHPDDDEKTDIDGYTLVSTLTDEDGNVVNYYTKTPSPSTIHTDWVDEQGNKLKDSEDGAHPDDDGKSDIKGYELVSTKDDNGNITNTYKPVTSEVVTSWVDEDGNKLKDDTTGSDFGKLEDFDGYTLDNVHMSEDGKHKSYIYKKNATPTPTPTDNYDKTLTDDNSTSSTPTSNAKEIPQTLTDDNSTSSTTDDNSTLSTPTSNAKEIPQAGVDDRSGNAATIAGAGLLGLLGISGLNFKRRKDSQDDSSK